MTLISQLNGILVVRKGERRLNIYDLSGRKYHIFAAMYIIQLVVKIHSIHSIAAIKAEKIKIIQRLGMKRKISSNN